MAPEPSKDFYKKFILVREGQRVRKGDVIAYLYTPPKVSHCHIHFHLMVDGRKGFLAPAIFEPVLKLIDSTKNATAPSWWIQGGRSRSDGKQDAVSQRRDGRTMADC
jgi:hypothetical protein